MATLASGLPEHVANEETLARFVLSSNQYNSLGVLAAAFLPNPRNGETSVFREVTASENLWELGKSVAAGRNLHGAALISAKSVRAIKLGVEAFEPPDRHANIVGWFDSPNNPAEQKAAQKAQAQKLAFAAQFLRPYS